MLDKDRLSFEGVWVMRVYGILMHRGVNIECRVCSTGFRDEIQLQESRSVKQAPTP